MKKVSLKNPLQNAGIFPIFFLSAITLCLCLSGCARISGYSNESIFPEEVTSIYVEMFDNQSFTRGVEFDLTDALAKRIESETPYKIVSNRDRANTVISGQIGGIDRRVLAAERETGVALENSVTLNAVVNWKDLKTGELLIEDKVVSATATYSEWQNQGISYASNLAANRLAQRIVELMEKEWK